MKVDDLEACLSQLFSMVRARGVQAIDLRQLDYYWRVGSPEWLDMHHDPKLVVGSLWDDALELKNLLADPDRASAVDLDRVAALLRVLSDQLSLPTPGSALA